MPIKRIAGLTIAFMLIIGMTGIGTWAFFSDTEVSTGNQLVAGTLDLKTNDLDGVTQTLLATNMAPGDTVGPQTIYLKNSGSINGANLTLAFSYTESDGSPNPMNMGSNATAALIEVTILNYGGSSILSSVSDNNSNTYVDIEDLKNEDLIGLTGINASVTRDFEIAVQLRAETGNNFQADGIDITMTFTLNQ